MTTSVDQMILKAGHNADLPDRISIGGHTPIWETADCPVCGSAPCGPHPDFLICKEDEEDWPCPAVTLVAEELERIAAITTDAAQSFDTARLQVRKDDYLTFAKTLHDRAANLRGAR